MYIEYFSAFALLDFGVLRKSGVYSHDGSKTVYSASEGVSIQDTPLSESNGNFALILLGRVIVVFR